VRPTCLCRQRFYHQRSPYSGWIKSTVTACTVMGCVCVFVCMLQVDDEMRCLLDNLKAMVAAEAAAKSGGA